MGRPRGSKNKSSQEIVDNIVAGTEAASEEANGNSALGYVGDAVLDPEREEIINQYNIDNNIAETVPEKTDAAEVKTEEAVEEKKEDTPAVATPDEAAIVTHEVTGEKHEDKKEEKKTVPYDALHEEREKRKLAQSKTRELEERLKELEAKINSAVKPSVEEDIYLTDEEKKLQEMEKSLAELKAEKEYREKESRQSQERSAREQLEKNVADTDKTLMSEGFPGFQFLAPRVGEELAKLIKEDPDNVYLDSPEGWKKIYKEVVFPTVKGIFTQSDKNALMEEKKAAKTGAGLVGTPGKSDKPAEKKSDEGQTYEEYLEMRRKGGL